MDLENIVVDITQRNYNTLQTIQYDVDSRYVNVKIVNNGKNVDLTNYMVSIACKKPDGKIVFNETEMVEPKQGLIKFLISEQISSTLGEVVCELKIYGKNSSVLTTQYFTINVTKPIADKSIQSTNEFRQLTIAMSDYNYWIGEVQNKYNNLEAEYAAVLSNTKAKIDEANYYIHPSHVSRTNVFTRNVDFNSNYFRIPFMTVCKDGTIVAGGDVRYNGGADHGFIDLGVKRSTDGGKTWTNPVIAIKNKRVDNTYSRCMDGTILYNENLDKLFLLGNSWETGNTGWSGVRTEGRDTNWDILLSTSSDRGISWSSPISLANLLPSGYNAFIGGVGQGITMGNGTMVFPIQINPTGKASGDGRTRSGIIYSTDNGASWKMSTSFTDMPCSECMVVEWGGALWLNCRSDNNSHRMIYKTTDYGTTWSYVQNLSEATDFGISCQGSMITVPYGQDTYILSSNPREASARTALVVSVMNRSASDWVEATMVLPWGYDGYSCLAYDKWNKKLYIVYEGGNLMFEDITYILPTLKGLYAQGVNSTDYLKDHLSSKVGNIYIDVINGSDANEGGTKYKPVKTFDRVSEIARKYKNSFVYLMQSDISNVDFRLSNIPGTVEIQLLNASGVEYVSVGNVYVRNCGDVRLRMNMRVVKPMKSSEKYYGIALEDSKVQNTGYFDFPLYVDAETGVTRYHMVYADGSVFSPASIRFHNTISSSSKLGMTTLAYLQRVKCDITFPIQTSEKLPMLPIPYQTYPDSMYVNHRVNIADINTKNYDSFDSATFKKQVVELTYNHYCSSRTNVNTNINDTRTVTDVYLNGNILQASFNIYFNTLSEDIENNTTLFKLPRIATPRFNQYITGIAYKHDSTLGKVVGEYGVTLQIYANTGEVKTVGIIPKSVGQIICTGVLA